MTMLYSPEYMKLLRDRVAKAEQDFEEAKATRDALAIERGKIVKETIEKRERRLFIGNSNKILLKRIRHRAVRLLLATKRSPHTIMAGWRLAFIREHLDVEMRKARLRVSKRLNAPTGRLYDYYNRYLVQRRFAIKELEGTK